VSSNLPLTGLQARSAAFLDYLDQFVSGLKPAAWDEVSPDSAHTAIFAIDIVNGFCYEGNLASPRIARIVEPAVRLFTLAHARGVRQFVLIQEWHHEHATEFNAFPRHCVRNTREAESVPAIAALSFAAEFVLLHKNSLSAAIGTGLDAWLEAHPVQTAIVVGDCTDLCTYNLAMHLRLRANERNENLRVLVPANCVDTYDLPVAAQQIGALPHDANLLHAVFLYHMHLNAIDVVREITD